jgi:hypothetical protein
MRATDTTADYGRRRIEVIVMFRIISRHSWDNLQSWHAACPGSKVEHLYAELYVLTVPAVGSFAGEAAS